MILADGTGHVPEEMGLILMKNLPVSAQLYVTAVVTAGAALLVTLFPVGIIDAPIPFIVLAVLSALTAVFKVSLPLARSESTLSVSYAVDFTALLLLGANPTMLIAATSALSQCTFRTKTRTPLHRTLFSIACLVLAVQAAGFVYRALGGIPGEPTVTTLLRSVVAMVLVYFFVNTGLVATAIALSTRQRVQQVWMESFLYNVPGYFVGAGAASEAGVFTRAMAEITVAENPEWTIPALDYMGVPTGIDIRMVVETGLTPTINTGIAHREPGIGQVGAGVVRAPMKCFEHALVAFARRVRVS